MRPRQRSAFRCSLWGLALAGCSAVAPGAPLPDFRGRDLNGAEVGRDWLRGHPAMVSIWAPNCFACAAEMPRLQEVAAALRGRGLRTVGVYNRGSPSGARALAQQEAVDYPLVRVDPFTFGRLGGATTPTTLFVSAEGKVVDVLVGVYSEAVLRAEAEVLLPDAGGGF